MKDALTSNSFKPSPHTKAEAEKKKKEKGQTEGSGNRKKRKGQSRDGSDGSDDKPASKTAKKSEAMCSLCGPGHADTYCWKSHDTDEARKTIEANKQKPEFKKHFKNLEHALAKRAKTS